MRKMGNSSVITNSLDEEEIHQNADLCEECQKMQNEIDSGEIF